MHNRVFTAVASGFVGVVALATAASAEPAGLKLVGLMNGHEEVDAAGNPDTGDAGGAGYVVAHVDSWAHLSALSDIKRSPKDFYFNVHTTPDFPNGAIRGQVRHLGAQLGPARS